MCDCICKEILKGVTNNNTEISCFEHGLHVRTDPMFSPTIRLDRVYECLECSRRSLSKSVHAKASDCLECSRRLVSKCFFEEKYNG